MPRGIPNSGPKGAKKAKRGAYKAGPRKAFTPAALPSSFAPIQVDGETWEPREKPLLQGILLGRKTVHLKKKGRIPERDKVLYTVMDSGGHAWSVWENPGLKALETIADGAEIAIALTGERQVDGYDTPFLQFQIGCNDPEKIITPNGAAIDASAPRGRKGKTKKRGRPKAA